MDDPRCLWLQVDVSGGGWAPCDAPVVVDDGCVASDGLVEAGMTAGGAVEPPPAPQVALAIRDVAVGLGLPWSDGGGDSDSDLDMGSSPLWARGGRRLGVSGRGGAGGLVEPVLLFPAVPVVAATAGSRSRGGTVPDSVDGGTRNSVMRSVESTPVLKTLLVEEAAGMVGANAPVWWS